MSVFPKTDISQGWGAHGTEGGAHASFFKRYYDPLTVYACEKFGLRHPAAEELAARFIARELERDAAEHRAVFRLFDPERGRFRSLLAASFWRFCRDELERESARRFLFSKAPKAQEWREDDYEICRLIAREFFNTIREDILRSSHGAEEAAFLELKWPRDIAAEPLSNAAIERRLGLSKSQVRRLARRMADRFIYALNRRVHEAGLESAVARELVGDCCRVLDAEQSRINAALDAGPEGSQS